MVAQALRLENLLQFGKQIQKLPTMCCILQLTTIISFIFDNMTKLNNINCDEKIIIGIIIANNKNILYVCLSNISSISALIE